ncbi:MAG: PQQ-binding-like beta-propeller repeat protein [Candidatus Kryptoniota bacterium]
MTKYRIQFIILIFASVLFLYPSGAGAAIDTTATWAFKTGAPVYSSPTYDGGSIYIGSDDGYLYRLDASTGAMVWKFQTSGIIRCKPAIADSVVYFESDDGNLYGIDQNSGAKIWSLDIGNNIRRVLPSLTATTGNYWDYMQSSPCVDSGVVYVGSGDSSFYAVDAQSGTLKWKTKTGNIIRSSPCVCEGMVYVGSWDGFIYAFNKQDGTVAWKHDTRGNGNSYQAVQPSPRVYDGKIYCGSRSGYFCALDAVSGNLLWQYAYRSDVAWVESSAAIANGVVYVGSSDLDQFHALNAETGSVVWITNTPEDTWSSPVYYNGTIYVGLAAYSTTTPFQAGGGLLAIDAATGNIKWQCDCETIASYMGGVVSSPTVYDSKIYYGSLDGKVYALDTAYTLPPKWCAATFQSGLQGFHVPSSASGSLQTNYFQYLGGYYCVHSMEGSANFSLASQSFAAIRDSVPMQNGEWYANSLSFMVYLPPDMPANGVIKLFVSGSANDSAAVVDTIGAQVKTGTWTTLWLTGLDSLKNLGKFDPATPKTIGVAIHYPAPFDTTNWTGNVEFRELWIYGLSFPTGLVDAIKKVGETPKTFQLLNNYPNPFNPSTVIRYQVPAASHVTLTVYDILGREVKTLVNRNQSSGEYDVTFDGGRYASGMYFCRMNATGIDGQKFASTEKLVLMK